MLGDVHSNYVERLASKVPNARNHTLIKHTDCQVNNCIYCDGGLSYCTVCTGAEGSLPTECPGRKLTDDEESLVASGVKDYVNGKWVKL